MWVEGETRPALLCLRPLLTLSIGSNPAVAVAEATVQRKQTTPATTSQMNLLSFPDSVATSDVFSCFSQGVLISSIKDTVGARGQTGVRTSIFEFSLHMTTFFT